MLKKFLNLSAHKEYWLGLLFFSVGLEMAALFYQYVLDYPPCVLCIHVRIWLAGIIVVSLLALQVYRNGYGLLIMQMLMTILTVGLFERSYQLLGTERGFVLGSCGMESGLPSWFALDEWLPSIFKVWEACGYTPEIVFGVTMAETLIVLSSILLFMSGISTVHLLLKRCLN